MVEHIYCINLERRPDRKSEAMQQFEQFGIGPVEFFHATDGKLHAPTGLSISASEWGCSDSHLRVMRDVVQNRYKRVLIFEDDVQLTPEFKPILLEILETLPEKWDYINLGPSIFKEKGTKVTKYLIRGGSYCAHAYLLSFEGAAKIGFWNVKNLKFCLDAQIARSPLDLYYCDKKITTQTSASGPFPFNILMSRFTGDIGFDRTPDFDFSMRTQMNVVIIVGLVLLKIVLR
jgi:hypothetical protein